MLIKHPSGEEQGWAASDKKEGLGASGEGSKGSSVSTVLLLQLANRKLYFKNTQAWEWSTAGRALVLHSNDSDLIPSILYDSRINP